MKVSGMVSTVINFGSAKVGDSLKTRDGRLLKIKALAIYGTAVPGHSRCTCFFTDEIGWYIPGANGTDPGITELVPALEGRSLIQRIRDLTKHFKVDSLSEIVISTKEWLELSRVEGQLDPIHGLEIGHSHLVPQGSCSLKVTFEI